MGGWRFYLFRWCVAALERDAEEVTVNIETEDDEDSQEITGGSGGLFERDMDPPDPMREEPWYEDKFGFGNG